MDSKKGFCSNKHENKYNNFRKGIDSELARSKPEPTEEQLEGYRKIGCVLIGSNKLNR